MDNLRIPRFDPSKCDEKCPLYHLGCDHSACPNPGIYRLVIEDAEAHLAALSHAVEESYREGQRSRDQEVELLQLEIETLKQKKTIPVDRKPPSNKAPFGRCEICRQPLGKPGGMAGTGMCGPCCTGESETLKEKGETW